MRRLITLLLILPALAVGQSRFGHGGSGGVSVSSLLPIIADSTLWHLQGADTLVTDGALPVKVSGLRVSGTTRLDGNLTMNTVASESLKVLAGGIRNEGGLRQKGLSQFGATATPVYITADGKVGIGTATSSPYNAFGLVSSTSGRGTGIGLTSAQWNKKRTDWVTASDTSAIGMYIDSAGGPRFSMKAVDGDTLGISMDGTYTTIKTNTYLNIDCASPMYFIISGVSEVALTSLVLAPTTHKGSSLGGAAFRWLDAYIASGLYIGGKGETPVWTLGTQKVQTEQTDSTIVATIVSGAANLTGYGAYNYTGTNKQGRQFYFGADTLALFNGARTGRDSSWAALVNGNVLNNGIVTIKRAVSLTDAGEYTPQIPSGMCGWGSVQIGDDVEWARFRFKTDGTVTLEANSTNVGTTNDTDTKLNIYDAGTAGIVIENQLGSTLTAAFVIECHLP